MPTKKSFEPKIRMENHKNRPSWTTNLGLPILIRTETAKSICVNNFSIKFYENPFMLTDRYNTDGEEARKLFLIEVRLTRYWHCHFSWIMGSEPEECPALIRTSSKYMAKGRCFFFILWQVKNYTELLYLLTVRELRSSDWYAGWWVTSCCATQKDIYIYTVAKDFMLLSILKKLLTSQ
jgi:hypothetical protein